MTDHRNPTLRLADPGLQSPEVEAWLEEVTRRLRAELDRMNADLLTFGTAMADIRTTDDGIVMVQVRRRDQLLSSTSIENEKRPNV